ncbi:phospholipase D family protein [Oceanisphaera sp. IT1-181]|uniref:phospholipase D family protein n=1 Tax=Oceanisphaera sp. IT1-181 TaxID=3081199 RepID=UPI0029C9FC1E|nr:phospholipase D family protein [Oceanisphaera sp. IT1-181]
MTHYFAKFLLLCTRLTGFPRPVCAPIPAPFEPRESKYTRLGQGIINEAEDHQGSSGFYLLSNGLDAFVTRLSLMEAADQTLDVQYYLFHKDATSKLFTHYLVRAADRGVRVRLLLDDFGHYGQERLLRALVEHPNISIRLFNPFANRKLPYLDFLTRFSKVQRRMHNKSFIADTQAAIIGGRNIGNTYFSADEYTNFTDLDVLGVGQFATEVSTVFDLYWQHSLAVPVQDLQRRTIKLSLAGVRRKLAVRRHSKISRAYLARLADLELVERLKKGELELYWAKSQLVYDHPDKLLNHCSDTRGHLAPTLDCLWQEVTTEALLVSPYFIPGDNGVATFASWVAAGAKVTVLTNSLAANDVPMVHAGYARYRPALLNAGVQLWELQPDSKKARKSRRSRGLPSSSKASLHAKTMIFDRKILFVGSLNLDPRSLNLNTEIGVLIHSSAIAEFASKIFLAELPEHAWRLETNKQEGSRHQLQWSDKSNPETIMHYQTEPQASRWSRFRAWVFGHLPLESLL